MCVYVRVRMSVRACERVVGTVGTVTDITNTAQPNYFCAAAEWSVGFSSVPLSGSRYQFVRPNVKGPGQEFPIGDIVRNAYNVT